MIKQIMKPLTATVKPFSFGSYRSRNDAPYSMTSNNANSQHQNITTDAQRVFEQFFRENPPKQSQSSFFNMKQETKKVANNFDPYKVLGIQPSAKMDRINYAFRQLGLKYHPKNNSSKEAEQKFIDVARAYEMLSLQKGNKTQTQMSLMDNFNYSIKQFLNQEAGISSKTAENIGDSTYKLAEIFSQAKKVKKFGNQKQVTIQKQYNRDGKLLKITRVQLYNEDGSVDVSETLDNYHDVKTVRHFKENGQNKMRYIDEQD